MNQYDPRTENFFLEDCWVEDIKQEKHEHGYRKGHTDKFFWYQIGPNQFLSVLNNFKQISDNNQRRRIAIQLFLDHLAKAVSPEELDRIVKDVSKEVGMNFRYEPGEGVLAPTEQTDGR